MKTYRTTRLSLLLIAAASLLVWASPAPAAPLRPGDVGPRGAGLRLSAAGGADPEGKHTCAVIADGTVRCWGDNFSGQLGNGSSNDPNPPVPVTVTTSGGGPLTGVVSVAAGTQHTCAVRAGGTVFCWGRNSSGQLGIGTLSQTASTVALQVVTASGGAFSGAVMVAAGEAHICALRADGTAHCWGENSSGQLGNSNLQQTQTTPIQVTNAQGVPFIGFVAIAAGRRHTCAVRVDGIASTVHCWGENGEGQIGIGSAGADQPSPRRVTVAGGGRLHGCREGRGRHSSHLRAQGRRNRPLLGR